MKVEIVSEIAENRGVWRKSSFSNSAGGSCVEAIVCQEGTYLRDSKNLSKESPVMAVPSTAWQSFIGGLVVPAEG